MIRLLVPLDGSPAAEAAISRAIAVARTFPAEIELLSVACEPLPGDDNPFSSVDWQFWKRQTEVYLARLPDSITVHDLRACCVSNLAFRTARVSSP